MHNQPRSNWECGMGPGVRSSRLDRWGEARWRVFACRWNEDLGRRGGGRLREGVRETTGERKARRQATGNFFFPLCSMPVLGGVKFGREKVFWD